MSKRILVSSIVGTLALGTVAVGGFAIASAATELAVENASARYVAPSDSGAGSLTFTADVSDDSGVRGLKVIAWPASSKLEPTEADMRHVESATCESTSDETARCTYKLKVTKAEAAEAAKGTWYISVLATAEDGDTKFVSRAATFDIAR
ncbi:DUF5707 domain-containing protein [Streptomyces fulvoviolaceus]|uniref:DUF5707 domain-containing protein n=1 Tax=Streptomyces fulvoviolaceus TaxID=285535 RepID=UPI0004C666AF|nr:DUF5707 domain-containing protein [Streptomyces fulvoviolaceus]MCT9075134.1 DUF5707 domain-containing protein [Streptomyces fulvoviolaceus]